MTTTSLAVRLAAKSSAEWVHSIFIGAAPWMGLITFVGLLAIFYGIIHRPVVSLILAGVFALTAYLVFL